MSHGLVSVSAAALVYAVASKLGDSIVARLQRNQNSKYIAELESKLLNYDVERDEEKSKLLIDFQNKLIQSKMEADNNTTLKVEVSEHPFTSFIFPRLIF